MTDATEEHQCRFVSSRGILKSTRTHVASPTSSMRKIPWEFAKRLNSRAGVIYLTVNQLPRFVRWHLWRIRKPFTLVTGDTIKSVSARDIEPKVFNALLNNRFLTAWYAQNLDHSHEKLHPIPLGVDYHTLAAAKDGDQHRWGMAQSPGEQEATLCQFHVEAGPIVKKIKLAFSNWHFAADRGNRKECMEQSDHAAIYFQPDFLTRTESWKLNSAYAFTLSPLGAGLDCHRTWEALLLGTIPIVTTSPIDPLYENLPVVILRSWSELTEARLKEEFDRLTEGQYDFFRLDLAYWMAKINGRPAPSTTPMTWDEFRLTLSAKAT
ncbi:hypothetical protein [uncultured Cohaesibacter sp.]|uniref:hypothetical protein n=1 Tax=uncultured Cohaesibacter sp. TaxID=1002546 RepID=UPI0029C7CE14|nr:hypothetical protein [uncultured Cohaesibacter sp.]